MSVLSLVDNSKTKHEVIKGVHWWSNPELSVKINSKGEVYSPKGKKLGGCKQKPTYSPTYSVHIGQGTNVVRKVVTFHGLFCYLALNIESTAATKLVKKDCSKGYTVDNVIVFRVNNTKGTGVVIFDTDTVTEQQTTKLTVQTETTKYKEAASEFYKEIKGETLYVTEDGAKFPTKDLAEWHQEKVTKGKSNAQIALDYNGGYVMAEQLLLNEVVYNCPKPYEHFKDVMDNNNGVQEVVGESKCVFDFSNLDSGLVTNFLRIPFGKTYTCSEDEAKVLQKILQDTQESFDKFNKSVSLFKSLYSEIIK